MDSTTFKSLKIYACLGVMVLFFQSIIVSSLSQSGISNNDEAGVDFLTGLSKDLIPRPQSGSQLPITYTDLPQVGARDNHAELDQVGDLLTSQSFMDKKPTSIPATYFAAMTLFNMDDPAFTVMIPDLVNYLMGHYNSDIHRFTDEINYTYYENNEGTNLLHAPYSPEIIHYMAIILLAHCGELQNQFSSETLTEFDSGIWNTQNNDGGFGVLFNPNSTLLETYFSVYALAAMSDFVSTFLFPVEKLVIQHFLRECQSNEIVSGPFNEFTSVGDSGWTAFLASWLALNTVDLMDGDSSEYKDDFVSFWQDYQLYSPTSHSFYGSFNEKYHPEKTYFYGTAIVGDCIRILGAETAFSDLPQADIVLLNGTRYNQKDILAGPNYFEISSVSDIDDLWVQFLVSHYLKNRGITDELKDENGNYHSISRYIQSYFVKGGASHLSQWKTTVGFDNALYSSQAILSSAPVNTEELLSLLMERVSDNNHFQAYTNFEYRYLEPAIDHFYNPVASTYHSISLLDRFNLLGSFYSEVEMAYLDYEGWFASQLSPEGYFYDNSRWYSGSFESTYMALKAQDILIAFDEGQNIETYYSPENISLIIEYLADFVVETDDYWFISTDSDTLDRFQATSNMLELYEILNFDFSDIRLGEWITMETFQSSTLSPLEFAHLCQLRMKLGLSLPESAPFSHTDIRTICEAFVSAKNLPADDLQTLSILFGLDSLHVYINMPPSQTGNQAYTYAVQIASYLSVEFVDNLHIQGEFSQFVEWNYVNGQYEGTVIPEYNADPYVWEANILFSLGDVDYEAPIMVSLDFSWMMSHGHQVNETDLLLWCEFVVVEDVGFYLNPNLSFQTAQGIVMGEFTPDQIISNHIGEIYNFSVLLSSSELINETDYKAIWDFNVFWTESSIYDFKYIVLESLPENDTSSTVSSSIETNTSDPPTTSDNSTTIPAETIPKLGLSTVLFGGTGVSGYILIWLRKKFQQIT